MNTPSFRGFSLRPIPPDDAQAWAAYACLPEVKLHTSSTAASVDDIRREIGTAEVTYDVTPAHWCQGIASAACRAATLWGFAQHGWHRIQATTVLPNIGSQKMLERCGFPHEGLLRNFRLVRGLQTDFWMCAAIPADIMT